MKLLCEWHVSVAGTKQLVSSDGIWRQLEVGVGRLLAALKGGLTKALSNDKRIRHRQKRAADAIRISAFPSIDDMKLAVHRAMLTLHHIAASHIDDRVLSREAQERAAVGDPMPQGSTIVRRRPEAIGGKSSPGVATQAHAWLSRAGCVAFV